MFYFKIISFTFNRRLMFLFFLNYEDSFISSFIFEKKKKCRYSSTKIYRKNNVFCSDFKKFSRTNRFFFFQKEIFPPSRDKNKIFHLINCDILFSFFFLITKKTNDNFHVMISFFIHCFQLEIINRFYIQCKVLFKKYK